MTWKGCLALEFHSHHSCWPHGWALHSIPWEIPKEACRSPLTVYWPCSLEQAYMLHNMMVSSKEATVSAHGGFSWLFLISFLVCWLLRCLFCCFNDTYLDFFFHFCCPCLPQLDSIPALSSHCGALSWWEALVKSSNLSHSFRWLQSLLWMFVEVPLFSGLPGALLISLCFLVC